MEPLLFLSHRIPYPPNKGDKVRSWHFLRHLASAYDVHLGAFVDDPEDFAHKGRLEDLCAEVHLETIQPALSRALSARGLATGEALTLPYYRTRTFRAWVDKVLTRTGVARAFIFSSAMAQYVLHADGVRRVVDFVDVDSEKWREYGRQKPGPGGWIYRREADRLLEFERTASRRCELTLFVTPAEAQLFVERAPECGDRVDVVSNGVDTEYFAPEHPLPSPFAQGERPIVFTGAMDYWPNVQAAVWFAHSVLPAVRERHTNARFYVVGMNPTQQVQALARQAGVHVTGRVADVRPYLRHASVAVAPLRIARGVQNKVLEAMSMACPVVASAQSASALDAIAGEDYECASTAETFAGKVLDVLDSASLAAALGRSARRRVLSSYSWKRALDKLSALIEQEQPAGFRRPRSGAAPSLKAATATS